MFGGTDGTLTDLGGEGPWHPTLVQDGYTGNPLFFKGLPVEWADADVYQYPPAAKNAGSQFTVGPSPSEAQGSLFGLRFASALNTNLLKTRKPRQGVTMAVPHPGTGEIPDQKVAQLLQARGMVTEWNASRGMRWEAVGGGTV